MGNSVPSLCETSCGTEFTSTKSPSIQATYLRIEQPMSGCFHLSEIEMFVNRNDFLQNKPWRSKDLVLRSNTASTSDPLLNILDQQWTTHYHNVCEQSTWIELQFPSPLFIYAVRIVNRTDCCYSRWNGMTIQLLDNQKNVLYRSQPFYDRTGSTRYQNGGVMPSFSTYGILYSTIFPPNPTVYTSPNTSPPYVWATGVDEKVYRCPAPCTNGEWEQIPGSLTQISVGTDDFVYGVNMNDNDRIVRCRKPCDTGQWETIPGKLVSINAKDPSISKWIWGTNRQNAVFRCPAPCSNGQWQQIKGSLKQVALGKQRNYGINTNNDIYRCDQPCGNSLWEVVPGKMSGLSTDNDAIQEMLYGVNPQQELWTCQGPCSDGRWEKRNIGTTQGFNNVDVGYQSWMYGMDSQNRIWRCQKPCTNGEWERVPGSLSFSSVSTE